MKNFLFKRYEVHVSLIKVEANDLQEAEIKLAQGAYREVGLSYIKKLKDVQPDDNTEDSYIGGI